MNWSYKRKMKTICVILSILLLVLISGCNGNEKSKEDGKKEEKQSPKTVTQSQDQNQELPDQKEETATDGKDQPKDPVNPSAEKNVAENVAATVETPSQPPKPSVQSSKDQVKSGPLLTVGGVGVEKEVSLSLDELKGMSGSLFADDYFALNSYGTKAYFSFEGVKIKAILDKAGLKSSASTVTFTAEDGYEQVLTVEQVLKIDYIDEQNADKKYPVIIAWKENGTNYDAADGAPFRLVLGQKAAGDVNKPQWVEHISKITVN